MNIDDLERLRIESRLTEDFCLYADGSGKRWMACNGYVMEYDTFCVMLMWAMANTMYYSTILKNRDDLIQRLKDLNAWDSKLQGLDRHMVIKRIYQAISKSLIGREKTHIESRFLDLIGI